MKRETHGGGKPAVAAGGKEHNDDDKTTTLRAIHKRHGAHGHIPDTRHDARCGQRKSLMDTQHKHTTNTHAQPTLYSSPAACPLQLQYCQPLPPVRDASAASGGGMGAPPAFRMHTAPSSGATLTHEHWQQYAAQPAQEW